jgi:translation elongation factor EF-G
MTEHLTRWDEGPPDNRRRILTAPITVIAEWILTSKSEFARVKVTVEPADTFEVIDRVPGKEELEKLGIGWPEPVILGLMEALMEGEPLRNFRVILNDAAYHDIDSTADAFRSAGREAGRKILEAIDQQSYSG